MPYRSCHDTVKINKYKQTKYEKIHIEKHSFKYLLQIHRSKINVHGSCYVFQTRTFVIATVAMAVPTASRPAVDASAAAVAVGVKDARVSIY